MSNRELPQCIKVLSLNWKNMYFSYRQNPKESATAAVKSLQLYPTLCDPIPGILQARTLEWVAISFANAKK